LSVWWASLPRHFLSWAHIVALAPARRQGPRPPSGAHCHGRQDRHSIVMVAFACVSASCRAH
jgi:hypothetical protein